MTPIQTLYFVDGFDLIDYNRAFLKYDLYHDGFNQGDVVTGNGGGRALNTNNSAFDPTGAQWIRSLSSPSTLGIHIDYNPAALGTWNWYTVSIGSTVLFTIHQRGDGRLDFLGPLAGLIATTVNPLPVATFSNLVILLTFGTSGSLQVFVNDSNALSVATEPVNFGSFFPDRAGYFWNAGFGPGMTLDNYFLYDGLANVGPCHVDSMLPTADNPNTVWIPGVTSPRVVTPTCFPMDNDDAGLFPGGAPDGDFSYISPVPSGNQLFTMQASRCYGNVLGVAVNACGRPNTGFSPQQFNFVVQLSAGLQVVGTGTLLNVGSIASDPHLKDYQTLQALMPVSPASGGTWVDSEITNGAFGVGSIELQQRVTAFNLEKITSLRAEPFNCGGASYSY